MKNAVKKVFILSSALTVSVLLSGCTTMCVRFHKLYISHFGFATTTAACEHLGRHVIDCSIFVCLIIDNRFVFGIMHFFMTAAHRCTA